MRTQWQVGAGAPKDGTLFLACWTDGVNHDFALAVWNSFHLTFQSNHEPWEEYDPPTYWAPVTPPGGMKACDARRPK